MDPIREGASGAAVEDIQERLGRLGYEIDEAELAEKSMGPSSVAAVAKFRLDQGMGLGTEVDAPTWSALVDAGYTMGDRTLYLRLPNFHGNDVLQMQERLNILGFSCGKPDGCFGVYTEAAVKEFQESQGMLADGMAFQDTFDSIDRLHHVWAGKPAAGPHPMGGMGFARAAGVLEHTQLSLTAEDPISRNVAGRIWNLASATSERSGLDLIEAPEVSREGDAAVIVLATTPLPEGSKMANLSTDDVETLPQRLRTTVESSREDVPVVRLELPLGLDYDGTFTTGDAQTFAVMLLDAICAAFDL
ncbi:Peptidoglycan-binding domain 1 protein [Olsenella uli DSM 7084]|uniref:Peptidoglycan-binding domain 1 protein n=2 Tax=Olsenella uli TaxID=133926 RepID=E1QX09_OLSUV|nr:peptidoglycan-binding protein [Olsenella uli]ADK68662.1 Peptidoglycan-binding domain 1 protein [Olsenella uli DSM 7084]EUB31323.1 peptidoglycan-binding domain protein [Olsenella uli MSTE5]KRO12138.1 peptidoglycan-binding domain 1 protein [Olsenella uli DSM 7084]MBS6417693.1 peptidoglycan-binding protein [Olsenella uli]